jgi:hypothetical protein
MRGQRRSSQLHNERFLPVEDRRNAMITRNLVALALALGTSGLMFAATLA